MLSIDQATPGADPSSVEDRSALLQRLLNSAELHRSARSREFLQYIGERALAGATYVSEQEIGIRVFGRGRDYDTAIDNIVRVNATHLRKRIEIYFTTEGAQEQLLLQLPRGSYLPVFETRPAEAPPPAEPPAIISAAIAPLPLGLEDGAEPVPPPSPGAHRPWKAVALTLGAMALAALVLCGVLLSQLHGLRAEAAATPKSAGPFWNTFFGDGKPTDLVLADASFAVTQDMLGQPISLKQYTDRNYMSHVDSLADSDRLKRDLQLVSGRTYGSFAEFRFAEQLMHIAPTGASLSLESAREFSAADLASHNVILVGSRRSNPWEDLFDDRLNYGLRSDITTGAVVVDNRHPQPGEPVVYRLPSDPSDFSGFCLIASFGPGESGTNLLMIQGTGSEETQAAGDFLRSPDEMADLARTLGRPVPRHFEVLLRTRKLPGAPLSMKVLSARAY